MINKAHSLIAIALYSLIVTADAAHAVEGAPVISRVTQTGELVVGTSGSTPLMSEKLESGELAGFDIDLASALAETMGVKLVFRTMPFEQLIPALEMGKVDVVISNMTMTIDRNMRVAFAGPYFVSGKCLVTREQKIARVNEPEDLKESDARIAAVQGTTSENFVTELLPDSEYVPVNSTEKGIGMVANGKVTAFLTDFPICLSVLKRHPDSGFQSVVSLLTYEPIGIAVAASDPLLLNLAENFIERARNVGLIQGLSLKWFGDTQITAATQ